MESVTDLNLDSCLSPSLWLLCRWPLVYQRPSQLGSNQACPQPLETQSQCRSLTLTSGWWDERVGMRVGEVLVWSSGSGYVTPGGGYGNPLQCSCLENPMDWGAWWATIHRVARGRTGLKWLSMQASTQCLGYGICQVWLLNVDELRGEAGVWVWSTCQGWLLTLTLECVLHVHLDLSLHTCEMGT